MGTRQVDFLSAFAPQSGCHDVTLHVTFFYSNPPTTSILSDIYFTSTILKTSVDL